ncbi:MAG: type II toxin-antitoxin system VapB family antitoxin [Acidobacteriaceae bacterium]|nr:type II toxin-antitoxin system VapB family antitoxin [Acidobacteriaceae bacterium]
MAVYISDEETCKLIAEYAKLEGKTKTAALRDLLREGVKDAKWRAGAPERLAQALKWLEERRPARPRKPLPKKVFDDLYSYIDEERDRLAKTKSSRKEDQPNWSSTRRRSSR